MWLPEGLENTPLICSDIKLENDKMIKSRYFKSTKTTEK